MSASDRDSVCLITSAHIASNPRIVKEANALAAAGYDVSVVGTQHIPRLSGIDGDIAAEASWKFIAVDFGLASAPGTFHKTRVRHFLARKASDLGLDFADEWAVVRPFLELLRQARSVSSSFYLAHNLGALPVAHRVARQTGAAVGFDAEDYHSGELPDVASNHASIRRTQRLETKYIPDCDYFSAGSPQIAEKYSEHLGVAPALSLLNVCSLREAPAPRARTTRAPRSIYWFSQTVGPGRGVEEVVEALALLPFEVELHLQGTPDSDFVRSIRERSVALGIAAQIQFLDPVQPWALPSVAADFDIGLALERREVANRDVCLTNKVFTYLMAGIPILANATTAQRALGKRLGDAMVLVDDLKPSGIAEAIELLLADVESLRRRAETSARLARERFNWEAESTRFLDRVAQVLERRRGGLT